MEKTTTMSWSSTGPEALVQPWSSQQKQPPVVGATGAVAQLAPSSCSPHSSFSVLSFSSSTCRPASLPVLVAVQEQKATLQRPATRILAIIACRRPWSAVAFLGVFVVDYIKSSFLVDIYVLVSCYPVLATRHYVLHRPLFRFDLRAFHLVSSTASVTITKFFLLRLSLVLLLFVRLLAFSISLAHSRSFCVLVCVCVCVSVTRSRSGHRRCCCGPGHWLAHNLLRSVRPFPFYLFPSLFPLSLHTFIRLRYANIISSCLFLDHQCYKLSGLGRKRER